MTAILAMRKVIDGKAVVVWGTDSLISSGSFMEKVKNNHKSVVFPNFVVLFAGNMVIQHVIDRIANPKYREIRFKRTGQGFLEMSTLRDVQVFTHAVLDDYRLLTKNVSTLTKEEDMVYNMIIVTKNCLYSPDNYGFVSVSKDYVLSGSGATTMSGLVYTQYPKCKTKEDLISLAKEAIASACALQLECGGDIKIGELQ
jgi:hypothetical protein